MGLSLIAKPSKPSITFVQSVAISPKETSSNHSGDPQPFKHPGYSQNDDLFMWPEIDPLTLFPEFATY